MISSIFGKPNSGKSSEIEKKIEGLKGSKLYVGTLPNYPDYLEIIARHRTRRSSSWILFELCGDIDKDVVDLLQVIQDYDNILIDGQIVYIVRAIVEFGVRWEEKAALVESFLSELQKKDKRIFFIDTLADKSMEPYFRKYIFLWHRLLESYSDEIYYNE